MQYTLRAAMSDNELCVKGIDGYYCLCFPNTYSLSHDEIERTFSEYGVVINVRDAGKRTGFHFVRFEHKEETVRCIEALRNHPKIRLAPAKTNKKHEQSQSNKPADSEDRWDTGFKSRKFENDNNKQFSMGTTKHTECWEDAARSDDFGNDRDNRNNDSNRFQKSHQKAGTFNSEQQGFRNGNQYPRNNGIKENWKQQDRTNNQNGFSGNDRRPTTGYENRRTGEYESVNEVHGSQKGNPNFARTTNWVKNQQLNESLDTSTKKFMELRLHRGTNADTFKPPSPLLDSRADPTIQPPSEKSRSFETNGPPPLAYGAPVLSNARNEMPALVTDELPSSFTNTFNPANQTFVVQDLVVANIHPNLGIQDIRKMFQKYNPVFVSDMKVVPNAGIRFCHVYLEGLQDALNAEKEFDGLAMFGDNLIVLRSEKLAQETGIF